MHTTFSPNHSVSFWDKIAPKYAKKPIKDPTAYAAKLEAVRAVLKPTDTVLELGCGTGTTAVKLAPGVANYTGSDVSPAMIRIADDKRIASNARNLHFAVADAAARAPGAPFDVILSFSMLHLVEDLPKVLRLVHGQLTPGGCFVSKTVCLGDANAFIRGMVRTLGFVGIAPPVAYLSREDLLTVLDQAGFRVEICRYLGKGQLNPFIVARRRD